MFKKLKPKRIAMLALTVMYTIFSSISITPVHAATYTATVGKTGIKVYHNYRTHDRFSGSYADPGLYEVNDFRIDGKKAFCVEPGVQISTNPMYAHEKVEGRSMFHKIGYSDEQIDRMAYISSVMASREIIPQLCWLQLSL